MSYPLFKIMTHDKNDISWEDDSFAEGWSANYCSLTRDGDIAKLKFDQGYPEGWIQKGSLNINAATYKYCVVCVKGDGDFFVEVYDDTWKSVTGGHIPAPADYDVRVYDLTEITTGSITDIRLGGGGGTNKEAYYDFIAFSSYEPIFTTDKILSIITRLKETDIDEFEIIGTNDVGGSLTLGRRVRIWAKGTGETKKIFAGVIEESTPFEAAGRLLRVTGRGFAQQILLRSKTKSFSEREISLAVKDLVEDITEITTYRVDTPSPAVYVTKDFNYEYIMDGLKDLAKWGGSQWEVKLGMGHDLRFRDRSNAPSLPLQISESLGHILQGVVKEEDAFRLFNKVVVIGGPLYNTDGDPDTWTEATTGWSVTNGTISAQSPGPVGDYFLRINFNNQNQVWCERSVPSIDLTKYKSLKLYCKHDITSVNDWNVWIEVGNDSSNYKSFPLKALGGGEIPDDRLTELEIPLDHPAWSPTGSPDWTNVDYLCIHPGCITAGNISGDFDFDGFHFWKRNVVKEKSGSSDFRHTREYVYRDDKIIDPDFAQDVADALFAILKNKEKRYRLPIVGRPFTMVGYKANVSSPTWGLSGNYHIVEVEHKINSRAGYITEVVLERPRLYPEKLLAEAIERKIKLIERGGIA